MAESESSIKVCVKTQKQKYEINSSPLTTIKEVSCSFDVDRLYSANVMSNKATNYKKGPRLIGYHYVLIGWKVNNQRLFKWVYSK